MTNGQLARPDGTHYRRQNEAASAIQDALRLYEQKGNEIGAAAARARLGKLTNSAD